MFPDFFGLSRKIPLWEKFVGRAGGIGLRTGSRLIFGKLEFWPSRGRCVVPEWNPFFYCMLTKVFLLHRFSRKDFVPKPSPLNIFRSLCRPSWLLHLPATLFARQDSPRKHDSLTPAGPYRRWYRYSLGEFSVLPVALTLEMPRLFHGHFHPSNRSCLTSQWQNNLYQRSFSALF